MTYSVSIGILSGTVETAFAMRLWTQIALAAALAAMTASSASRGAETLRGIAPAEDRRELETPKAEPPKAAPLRCTPNWTAKKYKPFGKVQHEIKKRYGDVRILRVALCGEGEGAFFQIVIISGTGSLSRVQIAAAN